jgi:hypothetical protein
MRRFLFAVVFFILCFNQSIYAQKRLAVLPITGSGVEASTLETVYMLLTSEIRKLKTYDIIPESDIQPLLGGRGCSEPACAIDIGRQVNASRVVSGSLNKLGEKIIFQYCLADVASGKVLLADNLGALQVEDLDLVTKRIAVSIVQEVPAEKTLEVGLVTEQESQEVNTRKAISNYGIAFGYLYPQKGYEDKSHIFVWDFRSLYEMRNFAVDALLGIRQGVALNIAFLYLASRRDFCPFIGAGLGFHAVSHERTEYDPYSYNEGNRTSDGFEISIKAGILAFRTYDFRVVANGEYCITFNDDDDRAFVVTLGVTRAGKKVFGVF